MADVVEKPHAEMVAGRAAAIPSKEALRTSASDEAVKVGLSQT